MSGFFPCAKLGLGGGVLSTTFFNTDGRITLLSKPICEEKGLLPPNGFSVGLPALTAGVELVCDFARTPWRAEGLRRLFLWPPCEEGEDVRRSRFDTPCRIEGLSRLVLWTP